MNLVKTKFVAVKAAIVLYKSTFSVYQIDSSTIDGNVELVQLYYDVTSVKSVFVSDKIKNKSDNFRIKCVSYSKINAILCVIYFLFLHFFI